MRRDPFLNPDDALREYRALNYRCCFVDVGDDGQEVIRPYIGQEFRIIGDGLALIHSKESLPVRYPSLRQAPCFIDKQTGAFVYVVNGTGRAGSYEVDGLTIQTFARIPAEISWFTKASDLLTPPPYSGTWKVPLLPRFRLPNLPDTLRIQLAQR